MLDMVSAVCSLCGWWDVIGLYSLDMCAVCVVVGSNIVIGV